MGICHHPLLLVGSRCDTLLERSEKHSEGPVIASEHVLEFPLWLPKMPAAPQLAY